MRAITENYMLTCPDSQQLKPWNNPKLGFLQALLFQNESGQASPRIFPSEYLTWKGIVVSMLYWLGWAYMQILFRVGALLQRSEGHGYS